MGPKRGCPFRCRGNLSDEQITRLNKKRRAFFEETRNLRENVYQKELELRSELAKADPDAQKAADLQTEVSNLTAQLDQKRIAHRIKLQKENPEFFAGRGYGRAVAVWGADSTVKAWAEDLTARAAAAGIRIRLEPPHFPAFKILRLSNGPYLFGQG